MKTETKAPKTARVTLPEAIYMQIKQAVKNDPTFKTVWDYLAHQLNQVKILACENENLLHENENLSQKLLDERAAAGQSIAASEQRVAKAEEQAKKLQEDLLNVSHANTELANQNAELSNQNAELSQRIVNLENEKAALEVEIGNLHSLIRGYQSTVQTLKEQISAMTQKQLESSNQINGLQAALDAESVNSRKYKQESEELARKLESREEVIFGLQREIAEKETFTGKIKNLFA